MVRVRWLAVVLVWFPGLLASPRPADAVSIAATPSASLVAVGGLVDVAIQVSGLGIGGAPSLGAFDLILGFDPGRLAVQEVVFGDPSLGDQLDLAGLGSLRSVADPSGGIELLEVSFDPVALLDERQAPAFVLARVRFLALAAGTSPLSLALLELSDGAGEPIAASAEGASLQIVPEPGTALLLGTSLAAYTLHRRCRAGPARRRTC